MLLLQYIKNFFPLDNFFKLLSKEELNEYVTYSKSNFDFIKEKNKCVTHISKENENYCFQCKTVFCSECSSNHLHHNWININDISLPDSRISKIAYKITIADKFIKANLNPLNKGVFSCIASNNIKNELILYFISLLLSNFNSCTNNYQVIDNLFYFFSSLNLTTLNLFSQPDLIKDNNDSLRMLQCVKEVKTNNSIKCILLLQDNKRLLVCSSCKDMEVYDTESLTCTMIIKGHANGVNVASLFDNKNGVITASNDNTIKIWKILKSSYKLIASINNGKYPVSQVLRFCDDKIVASIVTGAGDINIWNIKNYEKINLPKPPNLIDYLYSSSLSMVVKNNFLYVLKLEHQTTNFYKFDKNLSCDVITAIKNFYYDGEAVLINSKDKIYICGYEAIYIYNILTEQCETFIKGDFYFEGVIKSYAVLESGNILFGTAKFLYLFDAFKGVIVKKEKSHFGYIESIAKIISKNLFATCSNDQRIKIWKY